jgi:WD40 repeat protein
MQQQIHRDAIVALTFSPDGKWLASASWDKSVKVWNAQTGELRTSPKGKDLVLVHAERVHSVAFSPDGELLATGTEGQARPIKPHAGLPVHEGLVLLWDARKGRKLHVLSGHKSAVYGVAFSPSGKRLASGGSNGNVRVWDLEPWLVARATRAATIHSAIWAWSSPHSTVVDSSVALALAQANKPTDKHDLPKPRVVQSLTGNGGAALGIAYSPDGRYVAYGCSDSTARVYHLSTGVLRVIFRGHTAPVEVVRFSPDGRRLYSCSPEEGAVKAWDLTRSPEYSTLAQTRHPDPAGVWPEVEVRDLLQAREAAGPLRRTTGPDVEALAFREGGQKLVSVTVGGRLQTWDTSSGMLLDERPLPLNDKLLSPAILADFSPDGERLAARSHGAKDKGQVVAIWDVSTTELLTELKGHRYPVYGVRFSGDGQRLATFACDRGGAGRPHEVKVWELDHSPGKTTATILAAWEGRGHLFCLAFSPDSRFLALGGEEGHVEVVEWARGKTVPLRCEHRAAVTAVAFSRSGKWVASAGTGDHTVRVVETSTWKEASRAESTGVICDLAFSHDDKRLAGINRDGVKLWDVRTGQEVLTLRGAPQRHRDPPFNARLAFSPDGRRLAGSNWDESISVWEAEPPSADRQEARRIAADRRGTLWHLQEAENCLLAIPPYYQATKFHLDHMSGNEALPEPLKIRKEHLRADLKRQMGE